MTLDWSRIPLKMFVQTWTYRLGSGIHTVSHTFHFLWLLYYLLSLSSFLIHYISSETLLPPTEKGRRDSPIVNPNHLDRPWWLAVVWVITPASSMSADGTWRWYKTRLRRDDWQLRHLIGGVCMGGTWLPQTLAPHDIIGGRWQLLSVCKNQDVSWAS